MGTQAVMKEDEYPACCFCDNTDFLIERKTLIPDVREVVCPCCHRTVDVIKVARPTTQQNPIHFEFVFDLGEDNNNTG